MISTTPKVSLGLPVYNGENFVAQAIESILSQSFSDFELIISDNGSSDGTRQICESYTSRDSRISYFRSEKNVGAAENFNRVFNLSSGEYFKWVAHDDLLEPGFLSRCVEILDRDQTIILCFSEVAFIDEGGRRVDEYSIDLNTSVPDGSERFRSLLIDWHMCFDVFGLIRAKALRSTPVMGNYGHGDGVLLANLGLKGRFHRIPEVLFLSRRHKKQSMRLYGTSDEKGGNDYHAYAAWFDPSLEGKLVFPQWRILAEYYKVIWQPDLSVKTRALAHFHLLWWVVKTRRHLWGDLLFAGRWTVARRRNAKKSFRSNP